MSENQQEQSEAKLLAYIEGDLDPAARAEIEKHLEANPHHRRMLDELGATRDLVRLLPREPAPPELLETFQGHLERAELLSPAAADDEAPSILRINRWPQIRAAAAMLLVATGVAATIYFGYLRNRPGDTDYATKQNPPDPVASPTQPAATAPAVTDAEARAKFGADEKGAADRRFDKGVSKDGGPGPVEVAAKPAGAPADAAAATTGGADLQKNPGTPPEIDAGRLARFEEALAAVTVKNAWDMQQVRDAVVSNSLNYGANTRSGGNKDASLAGTPSGAATAPAAPRGDARGAGGGEAAVRAPSAAVAGLPPAAQPGLPGVEADRPRIVGNYNYNTSPLFVVVTAADLESASRQVKEYLVSNGIQIESVDPTTVRELEFRANQDAELSKAEVADPGAPPAAMPAAPEARQSPEPPPAAGGGAGGRPESSPKAAAGPYAAAGEERMTRDAPAGRAAKSEAGTGGGTGDGAGAGAAAPSPPTTRPAGGGIEIARSPTLGKAGPAGEPDAPAATDPAGGRQFRQHPGQSAGAGASQGDARQSLAAQQARNNTYLNNGAQIGDVVIARNMNRRKTLDLQNTVYRPAASQRAQVFEQTATTQDPRGGYNVQQQKKQQLDAHSQTAIAAAPSAPSPAAPPAAVSAPRPDALAHEKEMAQRMATKADAGARARSVEPATRPATFAATEGPGREGKYTDSGAKLDRPAAADATAAQQAQPTAPPAPAAGGTRAAPGVSGVARGSAAPPPAPTPAPQAAPVPARPSGPAGQFGQSGANVEGAHAAATPSTAPAAPAETGVAGADEEAAVDVVIVVLKPQFGGAEGANQAPAGPATAPAEPNAAGQVLQQQLPVPTQQVQQQSSQPAPPPAPPADGAAAKEAK